VARSAAHRAADYRSRRVSGLDTVLIDIDRELVLARLGLNPQKIGRAEH
jgi:hypothetical protein